MRTVAVFVALTLSASALADEGVADRVKKHFQSEHYTVTWGGAPTYGGDVELEVALGTGYGGAITWLRLRPGRDGVDVLAVEFNSGPMTYRSTWPPDRAAVTVKRARMKPDAYAALLGDLAVVGAANLKRVERDSDSVNAIQFWVQTRLTADGKTLLDLDWAGYQRASAEANYAKPQAAVALTGEVVRGLDFRDHQLTEEERAWASAKFARDWKRIKDPDAYYWVREYYIITIGVVGDAAALPTLGEILGGKSTDRLVYHAINAITRLTKKDVRDKPVEFMDVEKTRRKVYELLREGK